MKKKIILGLLLGLYTITISADSLQHILDSALNTNPVVQERLRNYSALKSEIDIAKSGYYPTIDLESSSGRKTTGKIDNTVISKTYNVFQNSLILRQNIFDGFSTHAKINYRKMNALSAAYSYLSTSNDIALKVLNAYIDLQREEALLVNSKLSAKHNTITYKKVQKSYKAGLSTLSEVSKIQSSLSLAKSNVIFQEHKLLKAHNTFRRVAGKRVKNNSLKRIHSVSKLPKTQQEAEAYALKYNPSIIMGQYDIRSAKAQHNESKGAFYPKVDIELSQNYNENYNEFLGTDDRTQGLVVLSYNLYNGGEDEAKKRSALSKVDQKISIQNNAKREVLLSVQLAWDDYVLAQEQIPFLKQYKNQSKQTLNLYGTEYQLGKRSLLDLISAENDLKRANEELISAKYNLLRSQYSIMHSMGLIIVSILGTEEIYYKRVDITSNAKSISTKNTYTTLTQAMEREALKPENKIQKIKLSQPAKVEKEKNSFNMDTIIDAMTKVRWKSR